MDVSDWESDAEYIRMNACLRDLKVVNDLAERCIKDIQEYADLAKDSQYREDTNSNSCNGPSRGFSGSEETSISCVIFFYSRVFFCSYTFISM